MRRPFYIQSIKRTGRYSMTKDERHESYEIYYLLSGRRRYFIHDRSYLVEPGDLVIIAPRVLHKTLDAGLEHERILLQFHRDFVCKFAPTLADRLLEPIASSCIVRLTPKEQQYAESLLNQMEKTIQPRDEWTDAGSAAQLVQLLIWLSRISPQKRFAETAGGCEDASGRWREVVKYLQRHYDQPLTLGDVAGHFYMSPFYLSRKFKAYTGFTLTHYLQWLRVEEASRLLGQSELKVVEVAIRTGFGDLSHFQRVFKKITGTTPLQYRKAAWRSQGKV